MNYQGLLLNVQFIATIVLRKQLNFKSAVIRSKRSSCLVAFFVSVGTAALQTAKTLLVQLLRAGR